jgi:hypothetical protein
VPATDQAGLVGVSKTRRQQHVAGKGSTDLSIGGLTGLHNNRMQLTAPLGGRDG